MLQPKLLATLLCLLAAVLAGCASSRTGAPVEERLSVPRPAPVPVPQTAAPLPDEPTKPLPGAENAGKPGYYTVKPGDTMIRIGLETGQNWRDIVRWNNLENPNVVEVGQVLRVVLPGVDAAAVAPKGVVIPKVESRPLDNKGSPPVVAATPSTAPVPPSAAATPAPAVAPPVTPAAPVAPASAAPREGDDDVNWMWPANGAVVNGFDDVRNKGVTIAGKAGDPVFAAADGRVVYAGSSLRGYGNLVIVKHNNTYLTAYAHNQTLFVKEDQAVKRGQKIAEMGSSDAERVQLHFEIRRVGKPIDPLRLLPQR